ncbi:iron uptake porin [Vampirovibrio chlorellavorus]|uniref:iron uptake porin n=1 Tax=Vampirovibrio chlorellavorus TaxID=758823 RepID=UPI0026E9EDAE|nr:iron uptake porin [Vampirovibrio chlorellavorus]
MTSRRVTPLLLAASIFLTGATGAFIGSTTSAHAITSVDELTDVNQNHWAYEALQDLVEKYDVIEGYPDHTFRGERNATRWELAAALNALIKSVGRDLARLGAEKADKADLETLARLQDEFKNELAALQARTEALESRASAIEAKNAEQDQRLSLLERTQLHGDASIGILADMNRSGTRDQLSGRNSGRDGIRDAISAIGRLRLTMDVPVREDKEDSKIGAGEVHTRLIAAFGRISPNAAQQNNAGAIGSYNSLSRIASDAALGNEGFGNRGIGGGSIGTNVRSYLYLEDLHYHQHFKSGIPLLTDWMLGAGSDDSNWATTGDLYVGSMPWRYLYDKSPYRGNENTQFQNSAFVNTPGIAINQSNPMIAYQWHQKLGSDDLSADLTTGVGTFNVGDVMDGLSATYEARLNYRLFDVPGNVYAGGYNVWSAGNSNNANNYLTGGSSFVNANGDAVVPTNRSGGVTGFRSGAGTYSVNAVYAGWNQEWYKGIGTTVNYLYSNGGQNNFFLNSNNQLLGSFGATTRGGNAALSPFTVGVRQSISGVLNVPMKVFGVRENDVFGVGYAVVDLYKNNMGQNNFNRTRFNQSWEHTAEAYYKWAVNDAISIIPSVQFLNNGFGIQQNGNTWVIGLRTSYAF